MRPFALLIALTYGAVVLDSTVAARAALGPAAPDFILLAAIVWMLHARTDYVFLELGLIGLAGDLSSGGPIGLGAAVYLVAGRLFAHGTGAVGSHTSARRMLSALATGMAIESALAAAGAIRVGAAALPHMLIGAGAAALYTAAIALVLSAVVPIRRYDRFATAKAW